MLKILNLKKYSSLCLGSVLFLLASCGQQQKNETSSTGEKPGIGEKIGTSIDNVGNKTEDKLEDIKEGAIDKTIQTKEYITDSYITSKIKAKILGDPLLNVFQIKVTTTDGVVQLTGEVDSDLSISRTLEIVNSVNGVKSISMELTIKKDEPK